MAENNTDGASAISVEPVASTILDDVTSPMVMDQNETDVSQLPISNMVNNLDTTPAELVRKAHENLDIMKKKSTVLFANYLYTFGLNPESEDTFKAHQAFKTCQEQIIMLQQSIDSYSVDTQKNSSTGKNIEEKSHASKNSSIVPNLPALQLKSDRWSSGEGFDSVHDYCTTFEKILRAHDLNLNHHWERLLPLSLSNVHYSWYTDKLMGKQFTWTEAKTILLDYMDTPYRRFLLMAKVGSMRQRRNETTRSYAETFQKLRREANFEDGVLLVVIFWVSLRESVQRASLPTIASRYGSKLPTEIDEMIELVCASGEDSSLLTSGNANAPANNSSNKRLRSDEYVNDHNNNKGVSKPPPQKNSSKNENAGLVVPHKNCHYCKKSWFPGHRCKEFFFNKKEIIKEQKRILNNNDEKVSRMAFRSKHAPSLEEC